MDHETSEAMIPGHGRQHVMNGEPAEQQIRMQLAFADESQRATRVYEGFEDLADQGPWASGEY